MQREPKANPNHNKKYAKTHRTSRGANKCKQAHHEKHKYEIIEPEIDWKPIAHGYLFSARGG